MKKENTKMSVNEIMIDYKYLFESCIKKLPVIIAVAVIFAIMLPAIMFYKDYKEYNASNNVNSTEELTATDQAAINKYFMLKNRIELHKERILNSIFMNLDATNMYEVNIQYVVEANEDIKYDISKLLMDYVSSGLLVTEMAKTEGMPEAQYLREVIGVVKQEEEETVPNSVLLLRIWAKDENQAKEFTDLTLKLIEEYALKLQQKVGQCSLHMINVDGKYVWSEAVYTSQNTTYADLQEMKTKLESHEAQLTDAQKNVIKGGSEETDKVDKMAPSIEFKYIVVGTMLGGFLVIALIIAFEVFGGKVQAGKELSERLGICFLGSVKLPAQNKIGKILDSIWYKDELREKNERIKFISAQIKYCLEDAESKELTILTSNKNVERNLLEELTNNLKQNGIVCEIVMGSNDNVLTFASVAKKNVILIETIGKSLLIDVYEEYKRCQERDSNIIGYVMMKE